MSFSQTISPVVVPYSGGIPGGLKDGTEIEVQGTIPHHAFNGFAVNLCQGPRLEPNTALHFNVRLSENCVVLNAMQNNGWGGEERKHGAHFHKGRPFDLRIIVKPQMFKLKVNNQHIGDFGHRMPKEMAQFLFIDGEVAISYVKFTSGGGGGGRAGPPAGAVPPQPAGGPIFNPPVPFQSGIPFPGGLSPGRMIDISGIPLPSPTRFTINLQNGVQDFDIAMHLDVRFNYNGCYNTVVRTYKQGGQFMPEERDISYFPFVPNANFDIKILCEPQAFKVAVNNQHMLEFRHKLPIQMANFLTITGDVRLTQVRFQ